MKFFEPNEKRNTIALYVFLVALFGVFCVIVGINISVIFRFFGFIFDVIKPVVYGLVFAFVLHPLVEVMENTVFAGWRKPHRALKRALSVAIVYVTVIFLVVMFCAMLIPEFLNNYDTFATSLATFAENFQNEIAETINRFPGGESIYVYHDSLPELRKDISDELFAFTLGEGIPLETNPNTVLTQVKSFFSGLISAVTGRFSLANIFSSALTFVNSLKNIVVGIILSVYFLASGKKLTTWLMRTIRAWLPHPVYRRVMWISEKVNDIFRGYIMVRIADGFIIGFFTFFVLFIARVPNRLLLSVVMGVASLFPFIGPIIGISFGALVVLIIDARFLFVYLISMIVLNLLDSRYIEPLLNKDGQSTPLAAIWVFVAIVVMGGFFGVIGIVFGIPMLAFIYSLIKEICEKTLKHKHLSVDTSAYFVGSNKHYTVTEETAVENERTVPPDMETYFAEKDDDALEASKNVTEKVEKIKEFLKKKLIQDVDESENSEKSENSNNTEISKDSKTEKEAEDESE